MNKPFIDDIRAKLYQWHEQNLDTALITLVNFEGSSPRPIGSQLIVNSKGEYCGLISGGCLETALIHEALECLKSNTARLLRYGRDSDYIDIQLPCGSGIDVFIEPNPKRELIKRLHQSYQKRKPTQWSLDLKTGHSELVDLSESSNVLDDPAQNLQLTREQLKSHTVPFKKIYQPRTQINVIGDGAIFDYFESITTMFDVELISYPASISQISDLNFETLDRWSTFITLSHDHHWEETVLDQVLSSEAFYISALGSKATHKRRLDSLKMRGRTEKELSRIKGPAGLDIGGQTPPEIALSIIAEIISYKNKRQITANSLC